MATTKVAEMPNRIVFGSRQLKLTHLILGLLARRKKRGIRPSDVLASRKGRQYTLREVVSCFNKLLALHAIAREK